ncbi:hypothetical protein [Streptomyces adelaidensis]|uniref:hypothetical protein n=1 Tax=Streptomyces adelaidensis TaxID=2796465 RepID=UPI0019082B43|nr:hypothetical protein [Streptomyces adelaidensis]
MSGLSPQMWDAILAGARRRRAPHLWPPSAPPALAEAEAWGLVRTYVLLPEEHRPAFSVRQFMEAGR